MLFSDSSDYIKLRVTIGVPGTIYRNLICTSLPNLISTHSTSLPQSHPSLDSTTNCNISENGRPEATCDSRCTESPTIIQGNDETDTRKHRALSLTVCRLTHRLLSQLPSPWPGLHQDTCAPPTLLTRHPALQCQDQGRPELLRDRQPAGPQRGCRRRPLLRTGPGVGSGRREAFGAP